MNALLKFIFIYIPAFLFYVFWSYIFLIQKGYVENPLDFNPNDYEPVASQTIKTDDRVTDVIYYEIKRD